MWSVKYVMNDKTLVTFTDELTDVNNLGSFTRSINNQKIFFVDGVIDLKKKEYKFSLLMLLMHVKENVITNLGYRYERESD